MAMVAPDEAAMVRARGRYLYAIVDGVVDQQPFALSGLDGAEVYALSDGNVAVVVSDLPLQKIRPERRRLAAHHEVLKRLMDDHSVLPMAFGLIAHSTEAVRRVLRLNRNVFEEQLRRVRGKIEMGLRVTWDVPNIFEYTLGIHPELGAMRDHLLRGGRAPSHEEKIELGRLFDRFLTADREEYTEEVIETLRPYCAEVVANKPHNEREVMSLACLVDRTQQKGFEKGVIETARLFNDHFAFDYNGPWPPHNFVEIDLQLS